MVGRKIEKQKIERLLSSGRSEFLAVTGRRRVGKTYLIDSLLKERYCFSMTGIQKGSMEAQLVNFSSKLAEYNGSNLPKVSANWQDAFLQLKSHLKTLGKERKHVIFIDELPWVDTPRSGFVQLLAHFWNDYLSKESNFILVICGSATSWVINKVVNDPGGLHNRITENIHLKPFTIAETNAFLVSMGLNFTQQDLAKVYMALGGIPYYLENLRRGESFPTAIERICFAPTGVLHNEYNNLFQALFSNAALHLAIVEVLAGRQHGLSHADILKQLGLKQQNGSYGRAMSELLVSDFVEENTAFGRLKRGSNFRLVDEFCIFYHAFLKQNRKYSPGIWQQLAESQSYKVWSGYAFETLCHKHIDDIKKAMGIAAVYTEYSSLRMPATPVSPGFQVDLLIDRKDNCINLCEIKFHASAYTIGKEEYQHLLALRQRFIEMTGTKKQVFLTFITNHGITPNAYSQEIVDVEIELRQFLEG